jgi:hypothetical protein
LLLIYLEKFHSAIFTGGGESSPIRGKGCIHNSSTVGINGHVMPLESWKSVTSFSKPIYELDQVGNIDLKDNRKITLCPVTNGEMICKVSWCGNIIEFIRNELTPNKTTSVET